MIQARGGIEQPRPPRPLSGEFLITVLVSVWTVGCGTSLMTLPTGPGVPAPDIVSVVEEATAACAAVSTYTAELTVRGEIARRRIPRTRLLIGLMAPASAYLDALASFGESLFTYAATDDQATLLLPRDDRFLAGGDPEAVLEAVTGIPLGAAELRTTITGCMMVTVSGGSRLGDDWRRVAHGSSEFYLRRNAPGDPWRLVSVVHDGAASTAWRAEYLEFSGGLPTEMRLSSRDSDRFDLRLSLEGIELDQGLDASVFQIDISSSMTVISLEELRRSGPLGSVFGSDER